MPNRTEEEHARAIYDAVQSAMRDGVVRPRSAELIRSTVDGYLTATSMTGVGTREVAIALAAIRLMFEDESGLSPDGCATFMRSLVNEGLCSTADITAIFANYFVSKGLGTGELPAYVHDTVSRVTQTSPGWADLLAQIKPV